MRGKEGNSTNPTKFLPLHFVKDKRTIKAMAFSKNEIDIVVGVFKAWYYVPNLQNLNDLMLQLVPLEAAKI